MCKILLSLAVICGFSFVVSRHVVHDGIDLTEIHPYAREIKLSEPEELSKAYWLNLARNYVDDVVAVKPNMEKAKNVILFIGDGMSIQTTSVARINKTGESGLLEFQKFSHLGLIKTYCVDKMVPDSACTATAYLSGIKSNYGTIGVNAKVKRYDCDGQQNTTNYVYSIAKWAMDAGMSAGIVTTTSITDASPAGVYANIANRDWENDQKVKAACPGHKILDIAEQLIYGDIGKRLTVIFGGGRTQFLNQSMLDENGNPGKRSDGKNLIKEWQDRTKGKYIWSREQLLNLTMDNANDQVLGLFAENHLPYLLEAIDKNINVPRLHEMTEKAIEILSKNSNGFFLFVEGGLIDKAHHLNQARMAINETLEFDDAVARAKTLVNNDDTLLVVTSDHAHTMTISGYLERGVNIYDVAGLGDDGMTYFSLSYANGVSLRTHIQNGHRVDPMTIVNRDKYDFEFPAMVPLGKETHGGSDVAVYASGPHSHLFTGIYEEHMLPHIMAFAACIGDGLTYCDNEIE